MHNQTYQEYLKMRSLTAILALLVLFSVSFAAVDLPEDEYLKGRIMVNFTADLPIPQINYDRGIAKLDIPELDALAEEFGVYKIEKAFLPEHKPDNPEIIDLSRWYYLTFPEEVPVRHVLEAYEGKSFIEDVDYHIVRKADYQVNDPMLNSCWHIANTRSDSAWDISKGSYLITIGIVDSGIDTAHVDLQINRWINFGEDVNGDSIISLWDWNGVDDDQNGFPDDFWGWDFVDQDPYPHDSDPSAEQGHGTHCAGDASADTDNEIGVAGPGFTTRIMPVRCGSGGFVSYSLQGVNYAANAGADIISMSYGNLSYSQAEYDVMLSAWQAGSILVGSAGNDNINTRHYPSAYDVVIGVGSSDQNDQKTYFSNYNSTQYPFSNVSVMAPGIDIMSTKLHGGYISWQGTSMSTPIVAGVISLIWQAMPTATNAEVVQVLYNSCDDIYPQNPTYQYPQLGYGRVNAFKGLLSVSPYLMIDDYDLEDNGNEDGRADPGETVDLTFYIQNDPRAQSAANVTGVLTTDDPYVNLSSDTQSFGAVAPGFTSLNSNPFVFTVDNCDPHFADFTLTMTIEGGSIQELPLQLEIGRPNILIVDDDGPGSDEIYYQIDFANLGVFVDNWNQNSEAISQDELNRYEIVVWMTGEETSTLNSTEQTRLQNFLDQDEKNLLFSSTNAGLDIGSTSFYSNYLHASFVVDDADSLYLDGVDGHPFSDGTTMFLLGGTSSGNNNSLDAINPVGGSEVCYTYRGTAYNAGVNYEFANGSKVVYFAFPLDANSGLASTSPRTTILANIMNWFYPEWEVEPVVTPVIPSEFALHPAYPNPFNPETVLAFSLPSTSEISLKVYNTTGQVIATLADGSFQPGKHYVQFNADNLSSGVYFAVLQGKNTFRTQKLVLMK